MSSDREICAEGLETIVQTAQYIQTSLESGVRVSATSSRNQKVNICLESQLIWQPSLCGCELQLFWEASIASLSLREKIDCPFCGLKVFLSNKKMTTDLIVAKLEVFNC